MPSLLRSIFSASGGISDFQKPAGWLLNWLSGGLSSSGESVGPEQALSLSSYFAAIRNISEDVAKLPLLVYRREGRSKSEATTHPLYRLLKNRANPDASSMSIRETLTAHALGWGGGFAEIVRDGAGTPVALYPIHPSRVRILRGDRVVDGFGPGGEPGAPLIYEIRDDESKVLRLLGEDVLHVHGVGGDGLRGWSVLQYGLESIGLGLAADRFGASFFQHGARVSGILSHPKRMSEPAQERLRKQFSERYAGTRNTGKPLVLEEDMKWTRIGIPPEEAQFLQTRKMQVEEIARWFRIPPHKIGHLERATFSNVESQSIDYLTDTLLPWIVRWEDEVGEKLFASDEIAAGFFADHNTRALLRADSQARSERHMRLFQVGAYSQNDIRDEEGLNPIPDGDVYYVPVNLAPSDLARTGLVGAAARPATPEPEPEPKEDEEEEGESTSEPAAAAPAFDARAALRPVFEDAARRVFAKERNACERALKRKGEAFPEWASAFFEGQREYIAEAFGPALRALSACAPVDEPLPSIADRYVSLAHERWFSDEGMGAAFDVEASALRFAEEVLSHAIPE